MARSTHQRGEEIRAKAEALLREQGMIPWSPKRSRAFAGETDIFGVFDLIALDPGTGLCEYIQLTTPPNHAARRKKVQAWLHAHDVCGLFRAEVWSWSEEKGAFRKEAL